MPGVKITGYGSYLPANVVTNQQLANRLKTQLEALAAEGRLPPDKTLADLTTSDEWIVARTGILRRHYAADGEQTSDLAVKAILECQEMSGFVPMGKGFLLTASVSPDYIISPPMAPIIQHKLGWPVAYPDGSLIPRFTGDVTAACSSFLTALQQAEALVRSGNYRGGYVVAADTMSRTINPLRREVAVILADGAFAMSLEATDDPAHDCFLPEGKSWFFGCDGQHADLIKVKAGGTAQPVTAEMLADPFCVDRSVHMAGNKVFKILVNRCSYEVIPQALIKAGLDLKDIDLFVFHQANLRMIEPIAENLGIGDRTVNNIQEVGNTTSASVGLALIKAIETGKLVPGMKVMITVMGGGLTWGTCILEWPEING